MVTLKASLVFSSTSLSKIPPSPKTWSGDTSFPLGARTLAYLRLNSVGGYLEASDWADPVLGGDISPLEISRSVRRYFWYSKYFFTWMCPGCQPITAGAERRGEKAASGIERRRGGGEEEERSGAGRLVSIPPEIERSCRASWGRPGVVVYVSCRLQSVKETFIWVTQTLTLMASLILIRHTPASPETATLLILT